MRKLIGLICLLLISGVSCKNESSEKLLIATAANMQFAMEELAQTFSEQTNIKSEIIVSSSGKLTAQIKAGAPYDVFVSADQKFPNELFKSGFTIGPSQIYAVGKLVIWSMVHPLEDVSSLSEFKKIAIANPKTAPYGKAAIELLQKDNSFERFKDNIVYGESISQVNQFVFSKAVDIGFTSKSVVLSSFMKENGSWVELNSADYSPIQQGIVLIKNSNAKREKAEKFLDFILSENGKLILNKFGYGTSVSELTSSK